MEVNQEASTSINIVCLNVNHSQVL